MKVIRFLHFSRFLLRFGCIAFLLKSKDYSRFYKSSISDHDAHTFWILIRIWVYVCLLRCVADSKCFSWNEHSTLQKIKHSSVLNKTLVEGYACCSQMGATFAPLYFKEGRGRRWSYHTRKKNNACWATGLTAWFWSLTFNIAGLSIFKLFGSMAGNVKDKEAYQRLNYLHQVWNYSGRFISSH